MRSGGQSPATEHPIDGSAFHPIVRGRLIMAETSRIHAAPTSPSKPADPAPGILLHKFVKANSWRGALTTDKSGENLPKSGSAWIYEKELLVSPGDRRIGVTASEIMLAIADHGYIVLPIADDF
jgi:hypothetical protein